MRFAYIDSQGNEVPIPGVDALALRIELGAIKADTQLYDATADRWGPAHTHEIFHTLSRARDDDGFVAPPPPVPPPGAPAPPAPSASEVANDDAPGDASAAASEPTPPPPAEPAPSFDLGVDAGHAEDPAVEAAPPVEPLADADAFAFDLTPPDGATSSGTPSLEEGPIEADAPDEGPDLGAAEWGAFDLTDETAAPEAEPVAADEPAAEDEPGGFDFGGMDSLELEADPFDVGDEEKVADPGAMDFGGGMQLEEPLSGGQGIDSSGVTGGSGLELEQPMSEFDADAPPAWMEQDGPSGGFQPEDDDSLDFSPGAGAGSGVASDEDDDEIRTPRERPEPRNRPSPPRRPKKRSVAGPLLGLLFVAALGAGGWFGWTTFVAGGGSDGAGEAVVFPPVTIPDIPAELLPQMRDLAEAALGATLVEMAVLTEEFEIAPEPRNDWLAGAYLANAGDYPDVEAYWRSVGAFTERLREIDTQLFHDEYVAAMETAEVAEDVRPILLERADSGFLATRQERHDAYARLDALVEASLGLHEFLVENQDDIRYDPAAGGVSQDPVLEAVPSTPELGDEMWDRVDRITGALDAMGTLDRVTTERLTAVLFDRIRRAGVE